MPAAALPGFRYIEVNLSLMKDGVTVPYKLSVKRFGDAGTGTPEYESSDDVPAPEADSAITAIGETVEPGEAAGAGSASDGESDSMAASTAAGDDFPMTAALLGGAGLVVLAGGITAVAVARRPR